MAPKRNPNATMAMTTCCPADLEDCIVTLEPAVLACLNVPDDTACPRGASSGGPGANERPCSSVEGGDERRSRGQHDNRGIEGSWMLLVAGEEKMSKPQRGRIPQEISTTEVASTAHGRSLPLSANGCAPAVSSKSTDDEQQGAICFSYVRPSTTQSEMGTSNLPRKTSRAAGSASAGS
jgi:hypothetical protein